LSDVKKVSNAIHRKQSGRNRGGHFKAISSIYLIEIHYFDKRCCHLALSRQFCSFDIFGISLLFPLSLSVAPPLLSAFIVFFRYRILGDVAHSDSETVLSK
jgi:hypothetical protein